ncbi:MAG TPA: hypothetical protein VHO02_05220 [Fibrobacteria bacterium]|nr:hypothetical protein [Fibrobacteria bacterium]
MPGKKKARMPMWTPLAATLLASLLLASCKGGGHAPTDPSPTCATDSTLCPPTPSCATDSTLCPPKPPRDCVADPVTFTHALIDPAFLKVVTPIGQVGGGNTEIIGRSYVFPRDEQAGNRLTLTAPADMEIFAAGHYIPPGAPTVAEGYAPDWVLLVDLGCGLHIELYHVKDVSDSIKSAMFDTSITDKSGYLQLRHKVKVAAGEPFGAYIKGLNSGAFDFILRGDSVTNHFANQARYESAPSNLLHVLCPYDLFQGGVKDSYYALLGTVSGIPIPGATCGTVERDMAGTPAGQWFLDSTIGTGLFPNTKDGDYGTPLPIVLGPDSTVYIGHMGPTGNIRVDRDNATWKDPGSVTGGWCYGFSDGWLWLKMERVDKMLAAYGGSGSCPAQFPNSGFKAYYR